MSSAHLRLRPGVAFGVAGALLCGLAWAAVEAVEPGSYVIIARTVMPHLEENLRYATTRELRCLRSGEPSSMFPILRHPSLAGCTLGNPSRRGSTVRYVLACASPQVATGSARLDEAPRRITGTLEIKMGGKNMSFAQRIEALRQGECER